MLHINNANMGKRVAAIDLKSMKNNEYVEFMTKVQKIINSLPIILEKVAPMPIQFNMLMEKIKDSITIEQSNEYTQTLADTDKERDNLHQGLCHVVEAFCLHNDEEKSLAAKLLKRVIKRYRTTSLRVGGYEDQTALIRTLTSNLTDESNLTYSEQIGLTSWISDLDNANNCFEEIMVARMDEATQTLGYTTRDVRKELTPIFRKIVQVVESFVMLGIDPQFSEFINKVNNEITYKK